MARLIRHLPAAAATAWIILAKLTGYGSAYAQMAALFLPAASFYSIRRLAAEGEASPIHKGMAFFTAAASVSFWIGSGNAWPARQPVAALYAVLFLVAVLPPLLGREVFTTYFARKTTPPAVWKTDIFLAINRHLTALWAVLFAAGFASAMVPAIFNLHGFLWETLFEALIPAALMLGLGAPANQRYPAYYQRKLGLVPAVGADPGDSSAQRVSSEPLKEANPLQKERQTMETSFTIVALNGSPHAGGGSTNMMLEMFRSPLFEKGFKLEIINLSEHEIEYCTGCAFCLENGRCWINDDHHYIVQRLLAADGIILASPVYFGQVTAQMKTFIDRSLAFGHKPQPTWKPGVAVSVSAGLGEIQVAEYLSAIMRSYGAFSVGRLTAMAVSGGDFIGRETIEGRARDLSDDLTRAIKEKKLYPANEIDLRYYHFMGALVSKHKDTIMKDDYVHWKEYGLFEGFEKYVQQYQEKSNYDPEIRKAWIQEIIAEHKAKREGQKSTKLKPPGPEPSFVNTCRELMRMMPFGFNPTAAEGMEAIYQFEITGDEKFISHLRISRGECTYHEGPADHPSITIKSPADVWLAISKGSLDGQYAFMSGKFSAEGDLRLLLKLKSLFSVK